MASPGEDTITVTVRFIKSFEHRNLKHVVYKDLQPSREVSDFIKFLKSDILTKSGIPPPFKKHTFDTLKISHQPFGAKTTDPVINTTNDDLILKEDNSLQQSGVVHETELSFFNLEDYRTYQKDPHLVW